MQLLFPNGAWQGHRKIWSWYGELEDGRDLGNWSYAVIILAAALASEANHKRGVIRNAAPESQRFETQIASEANASDEP